MAEKLNSLYNLIKAVTYMILTSELKEAFDSVNKSLCHACKPALKELLPGKQLHLMTDSIFRSAGYALNIKDDPEKKIR